MNPPRNIFVQVPSYRDPQLIPTLIDLVTNARSPCALKIVVCWQHDADETLEDFVRAGFHFMSNNRRNENVVHVLEKSGALVELIDIHFMRTKGCGWARNTAQKHYNGERYNLQIDAHHRFAKEWDVALIEMLESLRGESAKPLLTGYPPAFHPDSYPDARQNHVGQMLVRNFSALGVVGYKAVKIPEWQERTQPVRARFMSGGFVFSDGAFVEEVMNDESHFFSTEEIIMAVRAYTHGYDFFHPHRALLWHQYNSDAKKVWEDHTEDRKSSGEIEQSAIERSIKAVEKSLFLLGISGKTEEGDCGGYGLGHQRSLRQYERYAGLSFRHRGVRKEALLPTEPDQSHFDMHDDEWEDGLVCMRTFLVRIKYCAAAIGPINLESLVVAACAVDGSEIAQRNLSTSELEVLAMTGSFEYVDPFEASPSRLPAQYSLQATGDSAELASMFSIVVQEIYEDMVVIDR